MTETPHFLMEKLVNRFIIASSLCKSIDCLLINLSSIEFEVADFIDTFNYRNILNKEEIFREFLFHPKVRERINRFSKYKKKIISTIYRDPRFKNLLPYVALIAESLNFNIPFETSKGVKVRVASKHENESKYLNLDTKYQYNQDNSPVKDSSGTKYIKQRKKALRHGGHIKILSFDRPNSMMNSKNNSLENNSIQTQLDTSKEIIHYISKKSRKSRRKIILYLTLMVIIIALIKVFYFDHVGTYIESKINENKEYAVPIKELVEEPEKYLGKKIIVEGIISDFLYKPLYCLGGHLKANISISDLSVLLDRKLEYYILISKPPDSGKRIYYSIEMSKSLGMQIYVYRFHGILKKYRIECCTWDISGEKCVRSYIYVLEITQPGQLISREDIKGH